MAALDGGSLSTVSTTRLAMFSLSAVGSQRERQAPSPVAAHRMLNPTKAAHGTSRLGGFTRRNLGLKRRSNSQVDEVEDGGRAIVIEEGVTALVFSYAIEHDWLRDVARVDHDILKIIKKMTAHLEVAECSKAEWEATILTAYPVWDEVIKSRGGAVEVDLTDRSLRFLS